MPHPLAILGSARSDGNTAALLARLIDGLEGVEVVDLNTVRIANYRYSHQYGGDADDAFMGIVAKMIAAPVTVFATPVYWYSFSGVMKTFIDRLSDLLVEPNKDIGRKLRGRPSHSERARWALVSSGSDPQPDRDLVSAFTRTCEYLGVEFIGSVYGVEGGAFVDEQAAERVRRHLRGG